MARAYPGLDNFPNQAENHRFFRRLMPTLVKPPSGKNDSLDQPDSSTGQGLESILPVYRRSDITIARGKGAYLFSPQGERYLDFAAGIAVNALGHCHPHVVEALKNQADMLWHCSNMYRMPGLERLAQRLTE